MADDLENALAGGSRRSPRAAAFRPQVHRLSLIFRNQE
jgi:hypothetical protein